MLPGAENPFDSTLALYIVAEGPAGILIKLAGEVAPDPETGQVITSFLNNPQLPFAASPQIQGRPAGTALDAPHLRHLHHHRGAHPMGEADQPVTVTDSFQSPRVLTVVPASSGRVPPFKPGFSAGSVNNNAGSYRPSSCA